MTSGLAARVVALMASASAAWACAGTCSRGSERTPAPATTATVSVSVGTPSSTAPARASAPTGKAPQCPMPEPLGPGYPPWEKRHAFATCIRGPEGRWLVEADETDPDGWRHTLSFEAARPSGDVPARWKLNVISPTAMARRRDGHVVLLDLKDGVSLISPRGKLVWRKAHPRCGAIGQLAVGWDDSISFSCGYSLSSFSADGELYWQKWPFGDTHVRGPWVDRAGTLYVSGGGTVARLDKSGEPRWTFDTGFNRATGLLVWTASGDMVFDTSMAARHSPGPVRRYYPQKPKELFRITRAGKLVWQKEHSGEAPEDGWPEVLPIPEDGSHRVPQARSPR